MENWHSKPTSIVNWPKDIDYAMFIDENGSDSNIKSIYNSLINNLEISENERYFTITGCIFERQNYKNAVDNIKKLKEKYWPNGMFFDSKSKKHKYVCFHSRDIRRNDGAFNRSVIGDTVVFKNDLTIMLQNTKCIIISVTIDLLKYVKKGYLYNVYEVAFDFLLERYIFATKNNKKGIIMLEARGKNEDKDLLKHITNVIDKGRSKIPALELKSKIRGIYFNPKWNSDYSHTFTGLEIADLFSYPIHQYIKYNKTNDAFEILKYKIDKYPNFQNKGIKVFPK